MDFTKAVSPIAVMVGRKHIKGIGGNMPIVYAKNVYFVRPSRQRQKKT